MGKLTHAKLAKLPPGRHGDGDGLWAQIRDEDHRSWLFSYTSPVTGKVRSMGLGPVRDVTLKAAREAAARGRELVRADIDPLEARDQARAMAMAAAGRARAVTFSQAVGKYIEAHQSGWRGAGSRIQWERSLAAYAEPVIGDLPVDAITTEHLLSILQPIWSTRTETASRVRARVELILDYAKARQWRSGENVARWRGHLQALLPAKSKVRKVEHHPALPWQAAPAFLAGLRGQFGIAARALEFVILTASRTGEALGARWGEIDIEARTWTVPAIRMKSGREHRVPLSAAALDVLTRVPQIDGSEWVFPGMVSGRSLSQTAMVMLLRRMKRSDMTVHGMRSSFRDWAAETTNYPREVCEAALAHAVGNAVEVAYKRSDLFERRRILMEDWSSYCVEERGQVVPFRAGA